MNIGKVISVVNYKGGVGKTTVSFNFASVLAKEGYKVLLVDFDGQANLSSISGVKNCGDKNIIHNLLNYMQTGKAEINKYVINNNLDIAPCNVLKEMWETNTISEMSRETILKRLFEKTRLREFYDYIIIDNAPSIRIDFQNSLVASDEVIVVTEPSITANDGVIVVTKEIDRIKKYFNEKLKIAGILVSKVDRRTNFNKDMIKMIKSIWGEDIYIFKNYIPKSIKVQESQAERESIVDFKKDNIVANSFVLFTKEYLNI